VPKGNVVPAHTLSRSQRAYFQYLPDEKDTHLWHTDHKLKKRQNTHPPQLGTHSYNGFTAE